MTKRAIRARLSTLLFAAATLGAAAGSARADEPGPNALPITVVAVQTDDSDDQADALTKALRNAVRSMAGWSLGEGEYSLEVLTLSLKCGDRPDAACESRIADQIRAERFVWGVLNKKGALVAGELHLWERGKGSQKVPVEYSANLTEPTDEALKSIANDLVAKLTGGPPKGSVRLKAVAPGAQVFIDGQAMGALPSGAGTYPLAAGPHKISVKAPGYSAAESNVTVKPNVTADVTLTLLPTSTESKTDWRKVGGFIGVGAGVALAGVGLYSSVQVLTAQNNLDPQPDEVPQGKDACEDFPANKGQCDKARTFEVVQLVAYPLAAVAGGVGIYLLGTSDWSSKPAQEAGKTAAAGGGRTGARRAWAVRPQVGQSGGGLDVAVRW